MLKEYICISCPIGCHLTLEENNGEISITGNKCKRGDIYAREEYIAPKRVVTATALLKKSTLSKRRIPVKTDKPILKEHISDLLKEIYSIEVSSPITCGTVIISDYKNTGVSVVVTRSSN